MKIDEIKDRTLTAFREETPDAWDTINKTCETQVQAEPDPFAVHAPAQRRRIGAKWLSLAASFLLIFTVGALLGRMTQPALPNPEAGTASIYIDVNPSIEIRIDDSKRVVRCEAANEDAAEVIGDMDLVGVEIRTAMNAIVGAMYMNGYLSKEANSILVSVDKEDGDVDALLNDIVADVNHIFEKAELECSIIAQEVRQDDQTTELAREYGVSVGKMTLVEKIVGAVEEYAGIDIGELAAMTVKELNFIYSSMTEKGQGDASVEDPKETQGEGDRGQKESEKEILSGNVGGYVSWSDALKEILGALELRLNDISMPRMSMSYEVNENGERQLLYIISFTLKSTNETRIYKVNCTTGEIIEEIRPAPWDGQ